MSGFSPAGPPADVDPPTHGRIARTFYVYRMVRLGVTALICLAAVPATLAGGAPRWVPVLAGVALALTGLAMWQTHRRWRGAQPSFVSRTSPDDSGDDELR